MTEDEIEESQPIIAEHIKAMLEHVYVVRDDFSPALACGTVAMLLTSYMMANPDRTVELQRQVNLLFDEFCRGWRLVRVD